MDQHSGHPGLGGELHVARTGGGTGSPPAVCSLGGWRSTSGLLVRDRSCCSRSQSATERRRLPDHRPVTKHADPYICHARTCGRSADAPASFFSSPVQRGAEGRGLPKSRAVGGDKRYDRIIAKLRASWPARYGVVGLTSVINVSGMFCRYYVKAKLSGDLPSVRSKAATGTNPAWNELFTLEHHDLNEAVLTLTVKDDLPLLLGGQSRASRHGKATIPIKSILERKESKGKAAVGSEGKLKSKVATPETWYPLLNEDGTQYGEGAVLVELMILPKGGLATAESMVFDAKHGQAQAFIAKHEMMCRAYAKIDDIEKLKQVDDLLDSNVELHTVAGLKKVSPDCMPHYPRWMSLRARVGTGREEAFNYLRQTCKRVQFYETQGIKADVDENGAITTEAYIKLNYALIPMNISEKITVGIRHHAWHMESSRSSDRETWSKEGLAVLIHREKCGGVLDAGRAGLAFGLLHLESIGSTLSASIFDAYKLIDTTEETEDIEKKYGIGRKIGSGAFGTVKIAMDNKDGGLRAIKIVNKPTDNNQDVLVELRKEMEIMTILGVHPHVMRMYDFSEDEAHVYFVLEFCSGGDMMDRLMSRKPMELTEFEIQKTFKEIMLGLKVNTGLMQRVMACASAQCHLRLSYFAMPQQHMHSTGVVHRDIKPENVLYKNKDADSPVVICDFGLSATMRDEFSLRDACGTPIYMAPEVILAGEKRKFHEKTGIPTTITSTYGFPVRHCHASCCLSGSIMTALA
eukprot:scaffold4_cov396-Prasinococcus_capsulatus_cf.AAC.11